MMMRRRPAKGEDVLPLTPPPPQQPQPRQSSNISSSPSKRKRLQRSTRQHCLWCLFLVVVGGILIISVGYLVIGLGASLDREYAWVYERCALSYVYFWDLQRSVECYECWYHMRAQTTPTLWSPFESESDLLAAASPATQQQQGLLQVHFTLTGRLQGLAWNLALCSIEMAFAYLCDFGTTCTVNVWVVTQHDDDDKDILQDLERLLSIRTNDPKDASFKPFCLRRSAHALDMKTVGEDCLPLRNSSRPLLHWLHDQQQQQQGQQIPEHTSDAWRLVALRELGGLYLDSDVLLLPGAAEILRALPSPTVPTQHKVGAYRLNGGILRMDRDSLYLKALIKDHLQWAPRLLQLPKQTFGFLGPAALTRTFLSFHDDKEKVHILSPERVETGINSDCLSLQGVNETSDRPWAMHFVGKPNKQSWMATLQRSPCLLQHVQNFCPRAYAFAGYAG